MQILHDKDVVWSECSQNNNLGVGKGRLFLAVIAV
jgi:hypothetical protein